MRRGQPLSRLAAALLLGATFVAPVRSGAETPAQDQAPAQPLRVCADPDNLPFSSSKSGKPGFYIEIGQKIAETLGRPFEPVWSLSFFGAHTVRTTLLAKQCDLYVGLPRGGFMGPSLIFSKPFMHTGYAVVTMAGTHITKLSEFSGKRVAVQYSTTPQLVLAGLDDVISVTVLNPEDAVKALATHDVDAAFIWGPSAGYINADALHGALEVTPVDGDGMQFPVAIGFNRVDTGLRGQVDHFLDDNVTLIASLAAKYGLPTAAPIKLSSLFDEAAPRMLLAADTAEAAAEPAKAEASQDSGDAVTQGHEIFNGTCSHCHGPDAVQSERKIDLRLLHRRYGDDMETVFHTTVTNGRPSKGMPNWSGVFSEEDFKKIFAYLKTVQTAN